jgi:hypothetical protein
MLSAFAYAEFKRKLHPKGRSLAVKAEEVNPAYTNLIGAYKFLGFAISTHENGTGFASLGSFIEARRQSSDEQLAEPNIQRSEE